MLKVWLNLSVALVLVSCYGLPQDRLVTESEDINPEQQCQLSLRTGCVQGTIMAAPDIFVNHQKFEDSEDFALMFSDLIVVENKEGLALSPEDYTVELVTPINNRHFMRDFQVFIKGTESKSIDVMRDGLFYLDHLTPGTYDLRAQRKLVFKITGKDVVDEETGEVSEKGTEKFYCATLKSEQFLRVSPGQRITPQFGEFELVWRDQTCQAEENKLGVVTL